MVVASIALGCLAGCGSDGRGVDQEPIPTFSGPASSRAPSPTARDTLLPTDCTDVLSAEKMAALLGQPVDGVGSRAVIGLPAPSVGQLERVTCRYQRVSSGPANRFGAPIVAQSGPADVVIILTAYGTRAQARNQHSTNVAAERSDARSATELSIGSAPAVLFDEGEQDVLLVTTGRSAVSVALRRGVVTSAEPRAVLVDLAQRVLPVLPAETPATPDQPAASHQPAAPGQGLDPDQRVAPDQRSSQDQRVAAPDREEPAGQSR